MSTFTVSPADLNQATSGVSAPSSPSSSVPDDNQDSFTISPGEYQQASQDSATAQGNTAPPAPPEMVSQGRDRWGNPVQIPAHDNAASLVGPLAAPLFTAGALGTGEVPALLEAGTKALLPALTKGAVAVGEWAKAHPFAAKFIYHTVQAAITGTAIGAGSKIAGKIISAAPDSP